MIVHNHQPVSRGHDCGPEDFARVRNRLVHRPDRNHMVTFRAQLGIEHDRNKVLFLGFKSRVCCHDIPPKYKGILRRVEGSPGRAILGKAGLANSS